MLKAMIVDDEIMVRTTLAKMVDWQAEGFVLEGCYANGRDALDAFQQCPAQLVFTDIRMPVCDGLCMMDEIRRMGFSPQIVVLSAFDEFPLVKQAFKKGAADYVLKQELAPARLRELLREARAACGESGQAADSAPRPRHSDTSAVLEDVIFHNTLPESLPALEQGYVVGCFFLDEVHRTLQRAGGDVHATLTQPLTRLVMQLPQMQATDGFYSMDASRHFLFYSLAQPGRTVQKAVSFFARVQKAWKNYMNLSCTVGIAASGAAPENEFYTVLEQAEVNTTLRYVLGPGRLYDASYYKSFDPMAALRGAARCMPLIRAVMNADFDGVETQRAALAGEVQELDIKPGRALTLLLLYNLYYQMGFCDMQVAYKLGLEHRLYDKVNSMQTQRELVVYLTSVLRRATEYFESSYDRQFPDAMLRAKRYLDDNYMRAELSLSEVSAQSGYNEKYFCTLFRKRFEVSYSDYLTRQRIAAAKDLLGKTDLRMYEVCDAVGYKSVEHFLRTFKRETGRTPGQYRKENVTIHQ